MKSGWNSCDPSSARPSDWTDPPHITAARGGWTRSSQVSHFKLTWNRAASRHGEWVGPRCGAQRCAMVGFVDRRPAVRDVLAHRTHGAGMAGTVARRPRCRRGSLDVEGVRRQTGPAVPAPWFVRLPCAPGSQLGPGHCRSDATQPAFKLTGQWDWPVPSWDCRPCSWRRRRAGKSVHDDLSSCAPKRGARNDVRAWLSRR